MDTIRDLGLMPKDGENLNAPIISLLNQITDLDEDKVISISRTLNLALLFNDVVREQIQAMYISNRYEEITNAFN